jgi:5-methylthioadenosine/S-adenosylhomocysteine deaminase
MGGARVFGLEHELGSLTAGKRACIVLLNRDRPHLTPLHHMEEGNVLQLVTSCARSSDVDTVMVDGDIVVEQGQLTHIDEAALVSRCQRLAENRFGREGCI